MDDEGAREAISGMNFYHFFVSMPEVSGKRRGRDIIYFDVSSPQLTAMAPSLQPHIVAHASHLVVSFEVTTMPLSKVRAQMTIFSLGFRALFMPP